MRGRKEALPGRGWGNCPAPPIRVQAVQQDKLQMDNESSILQRLPPEETQLLCPSDKMLHRVRSSPSSVRDTVQPWHIQGSKECGAVPAFQALSAWGSLKDGFLGTVLSVIPKDTSSMGGGNAPLSNGSVDDRDHQKGGSQSMGRRHHECPLVPYYVGDRLVCNTLSGDSPK